MRWFCSILSAVGSAITGAIVIIITRIIHERGLSFAECSPTRGNIRLYTSVGIPPKKKNIVRVCVSVRYTCLYIILYTYTVRGTRVITVKQRPPWINRGYREMFRWPVVEIILWKSRGVTVTKATGRWLLSDRT